MNLIPGDVCRKQKFRRWSVGLIGLLALLPAGVLRWTPEAAPVAHADERREIAMTDADLIRVGISDDQMTTWEYPLTRISATGPFSIRDKATGLPILSAKAGEVITIAAVSGGLDVKPASPTAALRAEPDPPIPGAMLEPMLPVPDRIAPTLMHPWPGPLAIAPLNPQDRLKVMSITRRGERPSFRGVLEVMRSPSARRLSVINILHLEDYLKAVVPNELPMRYGAEAVKAQAVAARNYAIRPREKPWHTFDVCDSQLCQVYFGAQTETPASNQAIADTEGIVGVYNDEPILALFSSSHGGYAENYSNAFSDPMTRQFPAPPIAYLSGGPDMPLSSFPDLRTEEGARRFWTSSEFRSFDEESPYYRWRKDWTRPQLEAAINQGLREVSSDGSTREFVSPRLMPGQTIGILKSVSVLQRGVSGKAMAVRIVGSRGVWTIQKEFLIRKVLKNQGRMLPSANVVFTPKRDPHGALTGLTAQGGGFGHGVGLSQLGASWMAHHGFEFPQIIQHYYRGASLGSRPIRTGGAPVALPVMTRFDAIGPKGVLWIRDESLAASGPFARRSSVEVRLNDMPIRIPLTGVRTATPLPFPLQADRLNTLILFPDPDRPERRLTAWVELLPPGDSAAMLRSY